VRSKIVDSEKGVPLHIDFQLVDVTTCQPIKGEFVELWSKLPT
jgi:protocatechuate 3,4-dioxygenase beta subunit